MTGARMSIAVHDGVVAHEITDAGGILYFTDGTRTSWRHESKRLTCPDWCPWHLIDWSTVHD